MKEKTADELLKELKEIEESHRKENGELREKVKQLEEENTQLKTITQEYNSYLQDSNCDTKMIIADSEYFVNGFFKENFIPKSKVKDKIEEYDKQRIKMEKDDIGVGFTLGKEWSDLKAKIEVLQELLEESR